MTEKKRTTPLNIQLYVAPEEFARVAQSQRDWMHDIANKIERGEALSEFDARAAAGAIRAFAKEIPSAPKQGRGRPQSLHGGEAFLLFSALRQDPKTWKRESAIEYVANVFGAEYGAVEAAIRRFEKKSRG